MTQDPLDGLGRAVPTREKSHGEDLSSRTIIGLNKLETQRLFWSSYCSLKEKPAWLLCDAAAQHQIVAMLIEEVLRSFRNIEEHENLAGESAVLIRSSRHGAETAARVTSLNVNDQRYAEDLLHQIKTASPVRRGELKKEAGDFIASRTEKPIVFVVEEVGMIVLPHGAAVTASHLTETAIMLNLAKALSLCAHSDNYGARFHKVMNFDVNHDRDPVRRTVQEALNRGRELIARRRTSTAPSS